MEAGAYVAGAISLACVALLFAIGDRGVRIALALTVLVAAGAFALFVAYASGLLAGLVEHFL